VPHLPEHALSPYFDSPAVGIRERRKVAQRDVVSGGIWWRVFEVETAERAWAHKGRCLLFVSPEVIRRVWQYPADWWQLSTDELYAVGWRR
jgi:hypothetical protein